MLDKTEGLQHLGSKVTIYPKQPSVDILETFPNVNLQTEYVVELHCPEFTSLCPKTNQPDFANIVIYYTPKLHCVETKSLKLYLFAYRNEGAFMETIVNRILNDLVSICEPVSMVVVGEFNARGGIGLVVKAAYPNEEVASG